MFNLLSSDIMFDKSFDFAYVFKSLYTRWYLYVALLICFVGLALFAFLIKKPKRNSLSSSQKLAYISLFTAMSVVANIVQIPFPLVQLSLVASVAFLAGVLLGPVEGFSAAFIGDLIAGIIAPRGVYSPVIAIGTALFGFIPGAIFAFGKGKVLTKTIISYAITFVVSSVIINTIGLCLIYSPAILVEKIILLPLNLLFHIVNLAISFGFLRVVSTSSLKTKFHL